MQQTTHTFCKDYGCHIYQCADGAATRAVYPTTFHLETPDARVSCGVNSFLPEHLKPQRHLHYTSRTFDWDGDALPKED